MQLTGELSKVSLPNLIQLVGNGELTGKIAFERRKNCHRLFRPGLDHPCRGGWKLRQGRVDGIVSLGEWFFSFMEDPLANVSRSINPFLPEDSTDRLVREGIAMSIKKVFGSVACQWADNPEAY